MQNQTDERSSGIGPVMLTSVSPRQNTVKLINQNSGSPISGINMRMENKNASARCLGDLFNVQSITGVQGNPNPVVLSNPIQSNGTGNQSNSELVNMISSLQDAGYQIVETTQASNNNNVMPVSVIANPQRNSSVQVMDSGVEKTLALPMASSSMEEAAFCGDNTMMGGNMAVLHGNNGVEVTDPVLRNVSIGNQFGNINVGLHKNKCMKKHALI